MIDVLVPAAKDMVADAISQGIERMLFGDVRSTSRRPHKQYSNNGYVSYNSYKSSQQKQSSPSRRARASHDFDEIILETRGEAEQVLSHLVDLTIDYGEASVADLYELVGITSNFTDNKYGWYELKDAFISRVRNGYLINLPKTQILE